MAVWAVWGDGREDCRRRWCFVLVLGAGEGRVLGFSTLSTLHSLELG